MQNVVLTQLSIPELGQLFHDTLDRYFTETQISVVQPEPDEIGGIELAVKITGKAKPTIYGLVHSRSIPHSKQGKRLYFSRKELLDWLRAGKRKTQSELALEAENFSSDKSQTK